MLKLEPVSRWMGSRLSDPFYGSRSKRRTRSLKQGRNVPITVSRLCRSNTSCRPQVASRTPRKKGVVVHAE